jgi:hypothetical protein
MALTPAVPGAINIPVLTGNEIVAVAGQVAAQTTTQAIANLSGVTAGITQLTGDLTAGPGSGSQASTIAAGAVTSAKLASGAAATNVGALGGALSGTLPNPTLASSNGAQTAVGGAATLNMRAGVITSEGLTGATTYTLTLTNSLIAAASTVLCSPWDGAATGVQVTSITPGVGSVVIVMAMASLTGTVKIPFAVFN